MLRQLKNAGLGLLAGAAISLGGLLFILSKTYLKEAGQIVGALVFTVGLLLVCFLKFNLYTGKIGYLLTNEHKKQYSLDLFVMLIFNLLASMSVGTLCYYIFKDNAQIMSTINSLMNKKVFSPSINNYFLLIISSTLCGALVYTAVYLFKKTNMIIFKFIGIIIPIWFFVYSGFDHCIANGFYFGFGVAFNNYFMWINLLICIVGNSIGAMIINQMLDKNK